jgi:DNA-cytosine methyltransferase
VNEKPTHLDLFSGIGGFALAAEWAGFETVGFCDNEPYAQAVLKKHWPNVPIHGDIKALDGTAYRGVTLLTGGFPCQPFSCAGEQRGKDDDRYLWPQMLRVIQEARPDWIVGENVVGIIGLALDQVCSDLEACGYEVEPTIIPACGVDAQHRRNRIWIIARGGAMWPTPSVCGNYNRKGASKNSGNGLATAVLFWPTPTRREYFPPRMPETMKKKNRNPMTNSLGDAVQHIEGKDYKQTGQLNPAWVEWLMGYPIGWTELKDSETPSSRKSHTKSSKA